MVHNLPQTNKKTKRKKKQYFFPSNRPTMYKKHIYKSLCHTMKRSKLEGVRSNELSGNTTPIATANNSDSRYPWSSIITIINIGEKVNSWCSFFHGSRRSHEERRRRDKKSRSGREEVKQEKRYWSWSWWVEEKSRSGGDDIEETEGTSGRRSQTRIGTPYVCLAIYFMFSFYVSFMMTGDRYYLLPRGTQ